MSEHPERFDIGSVDPTDDRVDALRAAFPEVFREDKVDFDALRRALGDWVDPGPERFGLVWPGKAECMRVIQQPSIGTLVPMPEESVDWDTTQNVIIEGENLEVLKLLQKAYYGKVKLIYIDPPYNTGKEFIYPDNFREGLTDYLRYSGQVDEEGFKLSANAETDGRYHSKWLSMMYPRLFLARNLLREDGVIFVSIDDHEVHNLRALMNEIFGEENFVATICHKARASVSNDKVVSSSHNFVLFYAGSLDAIDSIRRSIGIDPDLERFILEDERGAYKLVPVDGPGGASKGNPHYEFLGVENYFRYSQARMHDLHAEGRIVRVGNTLQQKYYRSDAASSRKTVTTWWDDGFLTSTATAQLKELMDGDVFNNPKHIGLIQRMIRMCANEEGALVVDFFAGSGATAHAVLAENAGSKLGRRFLLVQLPEPIGSDRFETIACITRERVRRAARVCIESESHSNGSRKGSGIPILCASGVKLHDLEDGHH